MIQKILVCVLSALTVVAVCAGTGSEPSKLHPPTLKKIPTKMTIHDHTRVDDYYWLKQRENPEVVDYLNRENSYTDRQMAHTEKLQNRLFDEMKGRMKQDDSSVPALYHGYYYYSRKEEGKQYDIHCRRKGSMDAPEEIILDVNQLGQNHKFVAVRGLSLSPDNNLLAYGIDTRGRRLYQIRIKNLTTGEHLPDIIEAGAANMTWAADNKTLFYTKSEPGTLRRYQVRRYELDGGKDSLIFEEKDDTFSVRVGKTASQKYIKLDSRQTVATEVRLIPADKPQAEARVFCQRTRGHEYKVDHLGDRFFILTNRNALNFKVMTTKEGAWQTSAWQELVATRKDVLLTGFTLFHDALVLSEIDNGIRGLTLVDHQNGKRHSVQFDEAVYSLSVDSSAANDDPNSKSVRVNYRSFVTPSQIWDVHLKSAKRTLRKQDEVVGGFDAGHYVSERLVVTARDGAEVPISIVYPKGYKQAARKPLLLYAYGSYGYPARISFSSERLSLLERGFAYAVAHIRGGQDKGRAWYEDGKMMHKKNTFTDFIDCGKYLIENGYADSDKIFAQGGSAGGLLMGAVLNMEPTLFTGVHAAVPFVDVVTTMLDTSIPLTTGEYDEWGNPNKKAEYDYILSYSPYDNVKREAYTNVLVTTGFHDSQVQYWEPAKWVAKLRDYKKDDNLLLFKTNMDAGHSGSSGRFDRLHETALQWAFFLDLAGIHE